MTKTIQKAIIVLVFIMLFVVMGSVNSYAEENIASGTCGTCDWVIDANGKLTICEGKLSTLYSGEFGWTKNGICEYVKSVEFSGHVVASNHCQFMFDHCTNLTSVNLNGLDTSNVSSMWFMFGSCSSLTSIDLSSLDTSNLTVTGSMFHNCDSLTSIDFSNFDTSNVTGMNNMFSGCKSLTSINLNNLDTSNVTDMEGMFANCESLTSINLSDLNTSNVKYMSDMFYNCDSLTSVDLSNINTSSVESMHGMFYNCENLISINLSNLNTSNVTDMSNMFYNCESLTSVDLSNLNTSNVTDMSNMFWGCGSLQVIKVGVGFNSSFEATFPVKMYNYKTGVAYEEGDFIPSEDFAIYVSDLSIDPDAGGEKDTSYVHAAFRTVFNNEPRIYSGEQGFYYKDSYFYKDATTYNHSLATMSLCMAFTTYGYMDDYKTPYYSNYDRNIKELMTKCGFADKGRYQQYNFNEKPAADYVGCAIGSKPIKVNDKDITLIAVAVRGGGYESEWASNFDVGKHGDHDGFDLNADRVKDYVLNYITSKKIAGDIKIWITGYSRAGAVSTQAAAKLNDLSGFAYANSAEESGYSYVYFDKTSIYAYGFASPAGANINSDPHNKKYNNIFSIIEYNDPVPLVAPKKWCFDRYGTTKILPYIESSNSKKYKQYIDKVRARVNSGNGYKIDKFVNMRLVPGVGPDKPLPAVDKLNKDTQGTVLRKSIKHLADHIGNRERFVDNYQETIYTAFRSQYEEGRIKNIPELAEIILIKIVPGFFVKHPHLTTTLTSNARILIDTHGNQDYYVSWMQLMDENYKNSLPLLWGEKNYRVFSAKCPVDIYVYDTNNDLVASIINEQPSDSEDQEIVVSIDENGQKLAYLPIGSNYRVEVKARENCKVTCGVEEFEAEYGDPTRVTNFDEVSLNANEDLKATIPAFSEEEIGQGAKNGSDADYVLTRNGQKVGIYSDLHGEDSISKHVYDVSVQFNEKEGTVYGGGSFTEGSLASITAVSNQGYEFEGFYINGEKYSEDITDMNSMRIKVTKDVIIDSKFIKTSENESGDSQKQDSSGEDIVPEQDKDEQVSKYVGIVDLIHNSVIYNGKTQENMKVYDYNTKEKLTKNVDYTVKWYSDHKNIGTHRFLIGFKGKYKDTAPVYLSFKILPGKTKIKSVKRSKYYKKNTIAYIKKLKGGVSYKFAYRKKGSKSWKYVKKVRKCYVEEVWNKKNTRFKIYRNNKVATATIKKLKKNKKYQFKVRAFKKVGGKVYYGKWSKIKTVRIK